MTERARRFVHVFSTFGAGGPQVRAVQLMHHLGNEVEHVVMAMDGNTDARDMLRDDVRVKFADAPKVRGFLATRRSQAQWLRDQRADLVLTYNWGAIESVAAAKKARLPLVHHEDGFGPEEVRHRILRRSLMRRWLLRSVPVVVPSTVLVGIAKSEWRLRETNVLHLVNGVDLQRFSVQEQAPAGLVIGTVGGLRPEKDHDNLLRAVATLPKEVTVCLVGSGKLEADLREQAAQLGITERVVFAGQMTDTSASYRGFTMFVLSSRTEQMPIAMLEAMASGLAVVATDVGDVRQILGAEQDCVVPREDSAALARAITAMLDDPELRARAGQTNRRIVAERYESATCLERFCAVYRKALR
ncbi:MAG: glycosyltransferase involved in cell wall biosynthesis [Planctomycetota bacterium]|jgi:glycosyltransferase involved in cell wall biosynthesis